MFLGEAEFVDLDVLISLQPPKELLSGVKGLLSEKQHCRLDVNSEFVSGYIF